MPGCVCRRLRRTAWIGCLGKFGCLVGQIGRGTVGLVPVDVIAESSAGTRFVGERRGFRLGVPTGVETVEWSSRMPNVMPPHTPMTTDQNGWSPANAPATVPMIIE